MKTKIILYGKISKEFQKKFEFFNIGNLKSAISAIDSVCPSFKNYLVKEARRGINYQILVNRKFVQDVSNFNNVEPESIIEIVPCISGADPVTLIISLVTNLIVAGIQYLLFPREALEGRTIQAAIKGESYIFSSPDNLAKQGQTLPLGYGRLRVGSQIVSSYITNKDLKDNAFDNSDFGYTDNIKNQISEFLNLNLLNNNYL
jgi:predicted phage tail protein